MPRRSKAHASRSAARQLALQMLYQADLNRHATEQEIADQMRERLPRADLFAFGFGLVKGVASHRDAIDEQIDGVSDHWALHRMAATDRNLLRLGCYELTHTDTPVGVVINEAVDMAKKFGTAESPKFVNGVLDSLVPASKRPEGYVPWTTVPREAPKADPVAVPAHATPAQVHAAATAAPIAFRKKRAGGEQGEAGEGGEDAADGGPTDAVETAVDEAVEAAAAVETDVADETDADDTGADDSGADDSGAGAEPVALPEEAVLAEGPVGDPEGAGDSDVPSMSDDSAAADDLLTEDAVTPDPVVAEAPAAPKAIERPANSGTADGESPHDPPGVATGDAAGSPDSDEENADDENADDEDSSLADEGPGEADLMDGDLLEEEEAGLAGLGDGLFEDDSDFEDDYESDDD